MPLFVDFHYKLCSETHSKSTNTSPILGLNLSRKANEVVGDKNLSIEMLKSTRKDEMSYSVPYGILFITLIWLLLHTPLHFSHLCRV